MPAIIFAHPSSEVKLHDTCEPPVISAEPPFTVPTEEEWRRLDGAEAVARLIEEFGAARVMRWVKNIAELKGEAI